MPCPVICLLFLLVRLAKTKNERTISARGMFVCGDNSGDFPAAAWVLRSLPRRRAGGGEREDEDESEDEDVVQPATTIAGERAAGHGGSGVAATA